MPSVSAHSAAATRINSASHCAHTALEPVKAFVLRHSLHAQIQAQHGCDAADGSATARVMRGPERTQTQLLWCGNHTPPHRNEPSAPSRARIVTAARKASLERDDLVCPNQTLSSPHTRRKAATVANAVVLGAKPRV